MQIMNLAAKNRTQVGKKATKATRRNGFIPATIYGHGMKPVSLEVGVKEFHLALNTRAGENVVISLKVEGVQLKESTCLIKDIQHDPITEKIDHIDFTVISMTEKIDVKVPLVVLNTAEAAGIKEGGILDVVHHEIEIECLPTQIPEKFEVDVKAMKIGDAIHTRDLAIPKDIICKLDPDEVIVSLHPPAKEEVALTEEAATQPEVIEKGKKVDAEEGEAAAPAAKSEKPAKSEK
jgi:large subunit ribosomal protein L25